MRSIDTTYKYFITGSIDSLLIANLLKKQKDRDNTGAHNLFLGQVRADKINNRKVIAIHYSAYEVMAEKEIDKIVQEVQKKFDINCTYIFHSIGEVTVGEVSLLILVSAVHRQNTFPALQFIVEQIKNKVPIWKKELFE